jgi:hypothetical protein
MADIEPKDVLEAGAKAVFAPVHELFLKLTGPAAEEYGLMWSDSVKMRRTKRIVKGLAKTKRMLQDAGFEPNAVPDRLLLPIFEGMSVEDDEDLHTMWATLLANAAVPENSGKVRAHFIAILRQLAPDDAIVLMRIAEVTLEIFARPVTAGSKDALDRKLAARNSLMMAEIREKFPKPDGEGESATEERLQTSVHVLQALGLIELGGNIVTLSSLGRTFIEACRPPEQRK